MRALAVAAGWALAALIVWLSLTPSPPRVDMPEGDKFFHTAFYASLMFWFCLLYAGRGARIGYGLLWFAMGVTLELLQRESGFRNYEVADMLANAVGVLLGWALSFAVPMGFARKLR